MQLIGNTWTIESVSAHGLAGGFLAATLATLRPLAAGSARRNPYPSAGHSSNRTTDNLQECPPAARNPPQRPVRGMAACPGLSLRRIGASSHFRDAATVSVEEGPRPCGEGGVPRGTGEGGRH